MWSNSLTYLKVFQRLAVFFKEFNVSDLVTLRVDVNEVLQVHDFIDFDQSVLGQVDVLKVLVGAEQNA